MPFSPPSPDTLVEEKGFTPPSPNSLVEDSGIEISKERPEPSLNPTGDQSTTKGGPPLSLPEGAAQSVKGEIMEELQTPLYESKKFTVNPDDSRTMAVGKSAANIALSIPEFFTSKLGMGALVGGAVAPTATAVVFTVDMLDSLGKQITHAYEHWDEMTPAQQWAAITDMAGTGAFAWLTGKSTARGLEPSSVKLARELEKAPAFDPLAEQRAILNGVSQQVHEVAPATAMALMEQAGLSAPRAIRERLSEQPTDQLQPERTTDAIQRQGEGVLQSVRDSSRASEETVSAETRSAEASSGGEPNVEEQTQTQERITNDTEIQRSDTGVSTEAAERSEPGANEVPGVETTETGATTEGAGVPERATTGVSGTSSGAERVELKRDPESGLPVYEDTDLSAFNEIQERLRAEKDPRKKALIAAELELIRNKYEGESPAQGYGSSVEAMAKSPEKITVNHMENLSDADASKLFSTKLEGGRSALVPQYHAIITGMRMTEADIPRIEKLQKEAESAYMKALTTSGSKETLLAQQGKGVWYKAVIEGIKKEGPNYDAYTELTKQQAKPPDAPKPAPEGVTAIKNASVERDRKAMGLPDFEKPARQDYGSAWDDAMAKIEQDPAVQDNLIAELKANPRALKNATESALLHHRMVELKNEYAKATKAMTDAYEQARNEDIPAINDMVQAWSDKIKELGDITKKVGTEWGRTGAARKMLVADDFSLVGLEMQKRADVGGRKLTADERAQLVKIANDYKAKAEKLEQHLKQRETTTATNAVDEKIKELTKETKSKTYREKAEAVAKALQEWKVPGGVNSFGVVSDLFNRAIDVASTLLRAGGSVADALEAAIKHIKENFKGTWDEAGFRKEFNRRVNGEELKAIQSKVKENVTKNGGQDVGFLAQKLARMFVGEGVTGREELIDRVHEVLKPLIPDHTRTDTMNAISGYGKFRQLSKGEIDIQLRDLKGQMQQLGKLEDMASGKAPKKTGMERRTPSDAERKLIQKVNEAKAEGGFDVTDPEKQLKSALQAVKTRLTNEMKDLQERLDNKDFSKKERKPTPRDEEANKLAADLQLIKNRWNEGRIKDQLSKRTTMEKIRDEMRRGLSTPRALKSSFDLSAVLRQGGFVVLGHPIRGAKSFMPMLRAFASEKATLEVEADIKRRNEANGGLYDRAKLYLAPLESGVRQAHEEAFLPSWAEKIPGVRHSERAYITFLNKLRADSFDAMVSSLTKGGRTLETADLKAIANYINVATGRGDLGKMAGAAEALSNVFFSPRLVASRFQLLTAQPLRKGGSLRTKALIAAEYARFLGGLSVIYGLGMLSGATVETDSNSSDFGKLKFGNTRVDPMAGLAQAAVFMSRMFSGTKKSVTGKVAPLRGEKVPYGGATIPSVTADFLRSKMAPVPGAILNIAAGKNVVGEKTTAGTVAADLGVPMIFGMNDLNPSNSDIVKIMQENGIPKGTAIEMLNILGMGVQNFDASVKKPK